MNYEERISGRKRLKEMRGWDVHWACARLKSTRYILRRNCANLEAAVEAAPRISNLGAVQDVRRIAIESQLELVRHLHNSLAAVKTLVDHSRPLRGHLCGEAAARHEKIVASEIAERKDLAFVQDLRNFALHKTELPLITRVQWRDGSLEFFLNRTTLLDSGYDWKRPSQDFLDGRNTDIPVVPLMLQYDSAAGRVTDDLLREVGIGSENHLVELYEFSDKINRAVAAEGLDPEDLFTERFARGMDNMPLQADGPSGRR